MTWSEMKCGEMSLIHAQSDSTVMPVVSPPIDVRFEIQSFQHSNFTVTVYWTYPYDNSEVDMFSLTVITNHSRTIPGNQPSVSLTLPYNEVNTVEIKATWCSVTSEATTSVVLV